jgi:hypothetical protein
MAGHPYRLGRQLELHLQSLIGLHQQRIVNELGQVDGRASSPSFGRM